MAKLSKASIERISQCDVRLQRVFNKVIQEFDFTVTCGHRTQGEQLQLFKQGRTLTNGEWIKTGKTVTNIDGYKKKGKHNYFPSLAIDVVPYPVDWNDLDRFKELHKVVMRVASEEGVELVWGADWDSDGDIAEHSLQDYPHYELKE